MKDPNEKKQQVNNFAKYSAISFQMLATIGLFTFAGYKLDEYKQSRVPVFTAILSLVGVIISLYQVVKQLNKNQK
ncbi:MAG TPA: AtpZ/AtpI family protein [Pedobacter sp.]|nr:AtpZ/AtpI family protein [Pedobacter sp.]